MKKGLQIPHLSSGRRRCVGGITQQPVNDIVPLVPSPLEKEWGNDVGNPKELFLLKFTVQL